MSTDLTIPEMLCPLKRPLVVGYKGEIGRYILSCLLKNMDKAASISCFDTKETEMQKISRIKKSDTIFLCVPLQETVSWLLKYKKYLNGKLIVEQTTLKGIIFKGPMQIRGLNYCSMHLLFRPSATPEKDRAIAFISGQPRLRINPKEVFECSKVLIFDDWQAHDYRMAYEQALVHKVILTLAETLDRNPSTYISKQVCILADRIRRGDKILNKIIQGNPELDESVESFMWYFEKHATEYLRSSI